MEDAEFDNIKKIFDLKAGPADYDTRMKTGLGLINSHKRQLTLIPLSRQLQEDDRGDSRHGGRGQRYPAAGEAQQSQD